MIVLLSYIFQNKLYVRDIYHKKVAILILSHLLLKIP